MSENDSRSSDCMLFYFFSIFCPLLLTTNNYTNGQKQLFSNPQFCSFQYYYNFLTNSIPQTLLFVLRYSFGTVCEMAVPSYVIILLGSRIGYPWYLKSLFAHKVPPPMWSGLHDHLVSPCSAQ